MNNLPFDINEVKWQNFGEGMNACVFKPEERCCVQYWEIQPGVGAEPHSHPAAQVTYVQSGYMDLYMNGQVFSLTPGCFAYIPPEVEHSTKNVGQSLVVNIDFFMPDRDDRVESERIFDMGHNW